MKKIHSPFWRGFLIALIYYLAALLIFGVLILSIPPRDDVFIFFIYLPAVIVSGIGWSVFSLITIRRIWSRGALLLNMIVIVSGGLLVPPRPPVFPGSAVNQNRGELMPNFKTLAEQRKFLADYDNELQSWNVSFRESDVETSFGRTHIVSFGNPSGRPLVLLHWFYSNSTEWKYMAPLLQERFSVYAIDIIGDMGKSYASNPPTSGKEVSQWFSQVLDSLGLDKVTLCGHSNGGFQAMLIAQQLPDRIDNLILLAPAAGILPFSMKFYISVFGTALYPKDMILESFKNAGTLKAGLWSREMSEMLALSFRDAANQLRVYPRPFSDQELKEIQAPILLILGKKEMIYSPVKAVERMTALLPDTKVILLPECGHAIPYDAPAEASKAIDSFLTEK